MLRATAEHAITRFEHVIDVNSIHIEQVLCLNKILSFQFAFFFLYATFFHLVFEILNIIFSLMLHLTHVGSFSEICETEQDST